MVSPELFVTMIIEWNLFIQNSTIYSFFGEPSRKLAEPPGYEGTRIEKHWWCTRLWHQISLAFYLSFRFASDNGRQVFLKCQSLAEDIFDLVPPVHGIVDPLTVILQWGHVQTDILVFMTAAPRWDTTAEILDLCEVMSNFWMIFSEL